MKSLLFAFALILLFSSQSQAQVYAGDDYNNSVPPTVYYRNGKPYVPGYDSNTPNAHGQANTVEVGRPYYGYPGYGYGYGGGAYNDGNTVVVGQPYSGYGYYGSGGGIYTEGNTVYVGQPAYGYGGFYGY